MPFRKTDSGISMTWDTVGADVKMPDLEEKVLKSTLKMALEYLVAFVKTAVYGVWTAT